jgi:CRISPR-associated Csx10 family RAMP protein
MNFLIQATAQTPIAFRSGRDARREGTLGYVPGSALLGGLATAHMHIRPQRRDEFAEFFLHGRVFYRNLYPLKVSQANRAPNPLDAIPSVVYPFPRTAFSCKRFGGFRFHADVDDDDRHGVWDSLIAWAAFALSDGTNAALLTVLRDCTCGEPREVFAGFYRRERLVGQWGTAEASLGIFTRTGVSRARGAAAEGILYSREFLQAGSEFYGDWWVDDALTDSFEGFLDEVSSDGTLRVGHNRTRGLGKLVFREFQQTTHTDTAAEIETRARTFDAALRQAAGQDARHSFYLPVTLTADCIWPDKAGRYCLQMPPEVIEAACGLNGVALIYCNATSRRVSGWNSLWGLPKADEWAVAMGSVFLFGLPATPDWQALASTQANGVGSRCAEGFGTIRIADEFHVEATGV